MEAVCRHLFLRWRGEGERERNSVSPSVRQCRQLPLSCNISFLLFAAAAAAARHLLLFLPFASPSAAHHPNSVHSNSRSPRTRRRIPSSRGGQFPFPVSFTPFPLAVFGRGRVKIRHWLKSTQLSYMRSPLTKFFPVPVFVLLVK